MKTIIKKGLSVRQNLISSGKSKLPEQWALTQIKTLLYWLENYPVERVIKNNYDLIIILLPNNFKTKFKNKYNEKLCSRF